MEKKLEERDVSQGQPQTDERSSIFYLEAGSELEKHIIKVNADLREKYDNGSLDDESL